MAGGFRIAARALRQMGAELITSDDVALNELIKNAFDARSPRVKVEIQSLADLDALALLEEQIRQQKVSQQEAIERVDKAISPDLSAAQRSEVIDRLHKFLEHRTEFANHLQEFRAEQSIKVTDTGLGMSPEDLSDRFLVIGTPGKLIAKRAAAADAMPILGEKGIGRLSMMRLGNQAAVRSKQKGSDHWGEIEFRWDRFDDPHLFLDQVDVDVVVTKAADPAKQGRGYGSALLRHALARCDRDRLPAYLESSNPVNVPLYQRHGFEVIGTIQQGSSPELVPMLRKPR